MMKLLKYRKEVTDRLGKFSDLVKWRNGTAVMILYRLIVYLGLFLLFFGILRINNWYLLALNRTTATTILTWIIMTLAMHSAYGGYDVGRKKSKPIITNMVLGTFFTDVVTYIQLQIMNVNPNNNAHFELDGGDMKLLVLCFVLQVILITFMARLGNETYFRINPPRKCLIVLGNMNNRAHIEQKIGKYRLQWKVTDVALWNEPNLEKRIRHAEVVFLADVPDERRMQLLKICYDLHCDVLCKAQLQDIMLSSSHQVVVDDAPFLEMDYNTDAVGTHMIKRLMDVVISAVALVVLSPLMLVIALAIRMEDGKPVIYRQKRMTLGGREFFIRKFRTMKINTDSMKPQFSAEKDDPRITHVGRILRRTRLDELPQLWNILIGDMSLVGPRPEMLENVERYKLQLPTFAYREKMKAGLTGYAQIEGKYNTSPEDKLMLDLMYIENFTLWSDVKLLFRTFTVFFKKDSTEGFAAVQSDASADKTHSA